MTQSTTFGFYRNKKVLTWRQSEKYEGRPSRRKGDEVEGFSLTDTRLSSRPRFFTDFLDSQCEEQMKIILKVQIRTTANDISLVIIICVKCIAHDLPLCV